MASQARPSRLNTTSARTARARRRRGIVVVSDGMQVEVSD
jgi:hypothetical protein